MSRTKNILVGSHISIAGGLHKAIERGESIDCTVMQIFTKSNRIWFDKKISDAEAEQFKIAAKKSSIQSIVVHAGYLINIGSNKEKTEKLSTNALIDELNRCKQLGLKYLILHPGSHTGAGEEVCIQQIARNLDLVLEKSEGSVTILLETMAGQGTNIGYTFDHLEKIRSLTHHKKHIGFCLDMCHVFCAGYDIATEAGYKKTLHDFDAILGLEHLHAIHVNDSQTACNSRVDRHAPLGEGKIPIQTFKFLMNDKKLTHVPKILETPSDPQMHLWTEEIKLLKKFAG